MRTGELEVRVTSRAQNGILARFADECGGVKHAAEKLGISKATYGHWMNFKASPFARTRSLSAAQKKALRRLTKLTKRHIRDIFPLTAEQMEQLSTPRIQEHAVKLAQLTGAIERKYLSYTPNAIEAPQSEELRGRIDDVLESLSYREREIVKLRFGLTDGHGHTLEEVGHVFKLSKERLRQIEAKAIRKLQQPEHSSQLSEFLE